MTTTENLRPLTARQREVLVWLAEYIETNGFSPSTRDLCRAFGFTGPNGAVCHLQALKRKGCITWVKGSPRTVRITEAGRHAIAA